MSKLLEFPMPSLIVAAEAVQVLVNKVSGTEEVDNHCAAKAVWALSGFGIDQTLKHPTVPPVGVEAIGTSNPIKLLTQAKQVLAEMIEDANSDIKTVRGDFPWLLLIDMLAQLAKEWLKP